MDKIWFFKRWVGFTIALAVLFLPFFWMLGPVDDAYITCRYAENLAAGQGIVFNPGEKVEGCTAFGMMVILAIAAMLGAPNLVVVAQVLGVVSWALVCTIAFWFLKKGRPKDQPFSGIEAFGLSFLVGCIAPLAWAYSGMETPLVAAAWIGAAALHFRADEKNAWPIGAALVTVFAGLLRPDGILIAVPIGLSLLFPLDKKRLGRTVVYSVLVLGLFGGYWLLRWNYFGYPLPNTFYAKVGSGGVRLFLFGLFYIAKGMLALVVPLVALILSHRLVSRRKNVSRPILFYAGVCAIGIFYLMYVGGDFFPMQRFFIPGLAFWALLMIELWRLPESNAEPKPFKTGTPVQNWIKGAALVLLINLLCASVQQQLARHVYLVALTEEWSQVGRRLNETLPKDAVIAAIPIGALGYWSDRYILDMLGLIDVHIAHKEMTTGKGVIGHEKFDNEYVLSRQPDLILTWPMLLRPVGSDLLDWNMNHWLSPAQTSMLRIVAEKSRYAPTAIPMEQDLYVLSLTRSDLLYAEPYASWKPVEGAARQIMFARPEDVRRLIGKMGRHIAKGDLRRAAEKVVRPPMNEPKLF